MSTPRNAVARHAAAQPPATHAPAASSAVAAPDEKADVISLLTHPKARARIEPLLAPGDTYERIVAVIARATRKDPKLLACDKATLIDSAATICGWNLEIGETAHLVPFKGKVIAIMDYKGMIQILLSSGVVRDVQPSLVREGDLLEIEYGTESYAKHTPVWSKDRQKKKIIGALVTFQLRFNRATFHYMTYEEVDAIRQEYSQSWKAGDVPAWYMVKTAIRQAKKFLATTPALVRAFAVIESGDEDARMIDPAGEIAAPVAAPPLEPHEDFGSPADQPAAAISAGAARTTSEEDELEFDRQLAAQEKRT